MTPIDQGVLKVLTRLVEDHFGGQYPHVVEALKKAWDTDNPECHEAAWSALSLLGTINRDLMLMKAKEECRLNDWLTQIQHRRPRGK